MEFIYIPAPWYVYKGFNLKRKGHHINKRKDGKHLITSIDTEKTFDKNNITHDKTSHKVSLEGTSLNIQRLV